MDRRNVLILLIVILEMTTLAFQAGGLGRPGAVLEVTEVKSLEGLERVELAEEDYVPSLTVLLVDETPFDIDNWGGYNSETYLYGYWDTLYRRLDISLLNLTHLTLEMQFRSENGTQAIRMSLGNLTNRTSADENQTQILTLHLNAEGLSDSYPSSFSVDWDYQYVSLRTGGAFFRDVEVVSFRVWATSTIALVPVNFELNRSNNESLRVHQFALGESDYMYVHLHPRNVTSLPGVNVNSSLYSEFRPWRSADRIFLPPGTYMVYGVSQFNLTLTANQSTTCRFYAHIDKLSFVPDIKIPGTFVEVTEAYGDYERELIESPSIYVRSADHLDVRVSYWGPYLSYYFYERLGLAIEAPGSTDIMITVQLPLITLGQVSISTSLALFLAVVVGILVLIGVVSMDDRRHERRTRLAVQAGPVLLFVMSLFLPWASGHTISVYGSAYHDVYWTFIPGALTVTQWADTGQLIIMPMQPVGLFVLWLCLGPLLYFHVRNKGSDWQIRLIILTVALPSAAVLIRFLENRLWILSDLYLTGPLLVFTSILWSVFLAPKRETGACPEDTVK